MKKTSASLLLTLCLFIAGSGWANVPDSPLPSEYIFNFEGKFPSGIRIENKNGMGRPYMLSGPKTGARQINLRDAVKGDFTITAWIRIDQYPNGGEPGFTPTSPATIVHVKGPGEAYLRINGKKLELALAQGKSWRALASTSDLPLKKWIFVVASYHNDRIQLYLNGFTQGFKTFKGIMPEFDQIFIGLSGERRFLGGIDEVRIYRGFPGTDALQKIFESAGPQFAQSHAGEYALQRLADWKPAPKLPAYPQLMTSPSTAHPITGGISPRVEVIPWSNPDSPDLLMDVATRFFGSSISLYRKIGVDENNLPLYAPGEPLAISGRNFKKIQGEGGLFDLLASGEGTPLGAAQIVHYKNIGSPGKPRFGKPLSVPVAWGDLRSSLPISGNAWTLHDFDGDGIPDLLIGAGSGFGPDQAYWPDRSNIHNRKPNPNSGPGRGYDVCGNWLGETGVTKLFWAKGNKDASGKLFYETPRPVYLGAEDYQVQWRFHGPNLIPGVITIDGETHILLAGDLDKIIALPTYYDGHLRCGQAQPLLRGNKRLHEMFWTDSITTADINGDGLDEIVLCGNPGRVVVLGGSKIGEFEEIGSLRMQGGPVQVDTLATPARGHWDGDEYPDLIIGDSSGYLTYWPGTKDPLAYGNPVFLKTPDGKRIHHQAGYSGSIQGPNEARWGYLQPTLGDWNNDGKDEIITNDINASIILYQRTNDPSIVNPREFTMDGKKLPAAWRVRPAILPAKYGFSGEARPALLYLDWDGDAALAVPGEIGGTEIKRSEKLYYTDGNSVRLCGIRGHWGRAKLSITDWDGDGRWDIVWGQNAGVHPFLWKENPPKGGTPCWLRNVGSNEKPVFDPIRIIHLADGSLMDFHVHNTSVWPTDLNNDGKTDLIIGAEDGKVYYFFNKDLEKP